MARASFLTRRDGRYWFQIRFDPFRNAGDPNRHVRFALRTASYAVAVQRMCRVMSIVTEFKVDPDHRAATVNFFKMMAEALRVPGPFSEDQRVEWEMLERVGHRLIGAAGAVNHPIGVHSPEFWPTWKRFVERNAWIDKALRQGTGTADASGPAPSRSDPVSGDMPPDVRTRLGLTEVPTAPWPGVTTFLRWPELDNGTTIRRIVTEWGKDEALIEYEQDVSPAKTVSVPTSVQVSQTTALPQSRNDDDDLVHNETLADAIKARLDSLAHKYGDRRADESHGRVLRFALDFLGDRPLNEIVARDLRDLEKALTEIPNRTGIPKKHCKSLYLRYRYGQEVGLDQLTRCGVVTVENTYFGAMNAFLRWARTKTDWKAPDFVFDLECEELAPAYARDAFHDDELLRFFRLPLFTGCASAAHIWQPGKFFVQNELYWGYIIHIFVGLRPSEIGKLQTSNLVQDGDLWFIDMRKTRKAEKKAGSKAAKTLELKSANAYRRTPLPRLLIDLGLIDRKYALEKRGEHRLFPEWHVYHHAKSGREMWGHHLSKSWQYVKHAHSFERDFLTLYSGRHTLAGWYDAMKLPQRIRDRLLGHASQGVPGDYGPIDLTIDEARAALGTELQIQFDIADILLEAKLKADYGQLRPVPLSMGVLLR